jgi:hypothetical protein
MDYNPEKDLRIIYAFSLPTKHELRLEHQNRSYRYLLGLLIERGAGALETIFFVLYF